MFRNFLLFYLQFQLLVLLFIPQNAKAYTHFIDRDSKQNLKTAHWPLKRIPLLFSIDLDNQRWNGTTALRLAKESGIIWKQVPGSRMKVQIDELKFDINVGNFAKKVILGDQSNEIIIDQKGEILQSLGLDPVYVAGITIPITKANPKGDPKGSLYGEIVDVFMLINTRYTPNAEKALRLLTHEMGHALGLGHTNIAHLRSTEQLPIMFFDPNRQNGAVLLHPDDQAGLVTLYPADDFEKRYGAIRGTVHDHNQAPAFGVAVIATSKTTGPIGTWTREDGSFLLTGLPPEHYSLLIRAIDGSVDVKGMKPAEHVGGIYKKAMIKFCPEFYNDKVFINCRFEHPEQDIVEIRAGQTLQNVQVVENRGNPSKSSSCILGSAPEIPGITRTLPPLSKGKRGSPCPKINQPEPLVEPPPSHEHPKKDNKLEIPERKQEHIDTALPVPTCGCNSAEKVAQWGVILLLLGMFRQRKRFRVDKMERNN